MQTWSKLVAQCPLVPITNDYELERATDFLNRILNSNLDEYTQLYADTLHGLIVIYERSEVGDDSSMVLPEA